MMTFNSDDGSFPFTKKEMTILREVVGDKIHEMDNDLSTKDYYMYTDIQMLRGKLCAYINIMEKGKC